jgi:hypothetical protein
LVDFIFWAFKEGYWKKKLIKTLYVSFYYIRVAKHFQMICTLIGNTNLILLYMSWDKALQKEKKSRPIRDLGFSWFWLFRWIPRTTHLIYKFHRVQYLRNIVAMPLLPKNLKNALYVHMFSYRAELCTISASQTWPKGSSTFSKLTKVHPTGVSKLIASWPRSKALLSNG